MEETPEEKKQRLIIEKRVREIEKLHKKANKKEK